MDELFCKHCHVPIGEIIDPWGGKHGWIHNAEDGPDAYTYCGDEYGTEAEPGCECIHCHHAFEVEMGR